MISLPAFGAAVPPSCKYCVPRKTFDVPQRNPRRELLKLNEVLGGYPRVRNSFPHDTAGGRVWGCLARNSTARGPAAGVRRHCCRRLVHNPWEVTLRAAFRGEPSERQPTTRRSCTTRLNRSHPSACPRPAARNCLAISRSYFWNPLRLRISVRNTSFSPTRTTFGNHDLRWVAVLRTKVDGVDSQTCDEPGILHGQ